MFGGCLLCKAAIVKSNETKVIYYTCTVTEETLPKVFKGHRVTGSRATFDS